ncbi:hypothetical protein L6164_006443 [Bauhinia variegata]|uniref:Uncharacterized protein n=1 Tax=Bauhinia variegata TaxID=167791 RepID=A0ACB9PTT2_BAUVA|nr:hypothetical protein L6164_006443 [Bauhinia variegata]
MPNVVSSIGDSNNLHTELMGLLHGLRFVKDMNARGIHCYTDSMEVKLLKTPLPPFHKYAYILWDVADMLAKDWEVTVYQTLREVNACADIMAKKGSFYECALGFIWRQTGIFCASYEPMLVESSSFDFTCKRWNTPPSLQASILELIASWF